MEDTNAITILTQSPRIPAQLVCDDGYTIELTSIQRPEDGWDISEIIIAIRKYKGNLTKVCKALQISSEAFKRYRLAYPEVRDSLEFTRGEMVDLAVDKLAEKLDEGNLDAIKFVLNTQGRQAGWSVDPTPIDQMDLTKLTDAELAQLIQQQRRSAISVKST